MPVAECIRTSDENTLEVECSDGGAQLIRHRVAIADVQGTNRAEVADARVVRPLRIRDLIRKLRDNEVEIRIALAMRMSRLIDGHVVDKGRKIRPVIKVVAAQQELVRFALSAMQRHD